MIGEGDRTCIVEVYKNDCDACHYNGRMYDIFSQKLAKHDLLDKLPLYRMNLDNVTPYLGRFLYAPQYLFVRSSDGQIREIKTLNPLGDKLNCTTFLEDLQETSGLPIQDKVKIDSRKHIALYSKKGNLADNFDYDFDIVTAKSKLFPN